MYFEFGALAAAFGDSPVDACWQYIRSLACHVLQFQAWAPALQRCPQVAALVHVCRCAIPVRESVGGQPAASLWRGLASSKAFVAGLLFVGQLPASWRRAQTPARVRKVAIMLRLDAVMMCTVGELCAHVHSHIP